MFNYEQSDIDQLDIFLENPETKTIYVVFQEELCPTTLKPHLQGYLHFQRSVRKHFVRGLLRPATEITAANGTAAQNKIYCTKDESRKPGTMPHEHGTSPVGQGHRSDWDTVKDDLLQGMSTADLAERHPRIVASGGVDRLRSALTKPRVLGTPVETIVYWGLPGSGKTWKAIQEAQADGRPYYVKSASTGQWWDGYEGQPLIVWDDFAPEEIPISHFLGICQAIPLRVQVKGSTAQFLGVKIWITSNFDPSQWWIHHHSQYGAVQRRITSSTYFEKPYGQS